MINPCLYIGHIEKKGRGVFTDNPLAAGIVVETSPVIVMNAKDRKLLDKTLLHDYIFEWQPEGEGLQCCMALGWIPIYNHSYNSNCEYFMNYDTQTIFVKTAKNIKAGQELTINYNGDRDNKKRVWFDVEK